MSLWNTVCSVHLCKSVRNITHPLDEIRPMRLAGEFYLSQNSQISQNFLRTFRVHKEVVHLLLMIIFSLLRPSLWVLFSVQIHSEELKALEGVGAGLLGNSGKLHLYGVVTLFGVEALRNHC